MFNKHGYFVCFFIFISALFFSSLQAEDYQANDIWSSEQSFSGEVGVIYTITILSDGGMEGGSIFRNEGRAFSIQGHEIVLSEGCDWEEGDSLYFEYFGKTDRFFYEGKTYYFYLYNITNIEKNNSTSISVFRGK